MLPRIVGFAHEIRDSVPRDTVAGSRRDDTPAPRTPSAFPARVWASTAATSSPGRAAVTCSACAGQSSTYHRVLPLSALHDEGRA